MKKEFIRLPLLMILVVTADIIFTCYITYCLTLYFSGIPFFSRFLSPMAILLILCAIIGLTLTSFIIHVFLKPIIRINRAMNQVAQGDFDVSLEESSSVDEIRQMEHNFNKMTKELRATEILQSDFISNVSHEFKTPINAIEGYATLLQQEITSKDEAVYVDRILTSTRRLSDLVGNILLLSKVENQTIQLNQKTEFRLDEQIRQSIVFLESKWEKKNIEFEIDMDEIKCTNYESLLFHVWNNLIDNAIKFVDINGIIKISTKQIDENIIFTIQDNGPGISEEASQHIFDKFYQQDNSHQTEGYGLGLTLVKRILSITSGEIKVTNVQPHGCLFTVKLPLSI